MLKSLSLPTTADAVRELRLGDELLVSGRILTARAVALGRLAAGDDPAVRALAAGTLLYHCGPVVEREGAEWRFVAAGPTSSLRMEPWQADVIERYGLRGILGKGGMGPRTLAALREHGAVYLHAVGSLAVVLARCVAKVHGVHGLEALGAAEAIWDVEVRDFPAVVTMDAHGQTLHATADPRLASIANQLTEPGG